LIINIKDKDVYECNCCGYITIIDSDSEPNKCKHCEIMKCETFDGFSLLGKGNSLLIDNSQKGSK